jgi:ribonuclease HI
MKSAMNYITSSSLSPDSDIKLQRVLDRYTDGPITGVFTDGGASPNPGPGGWGYVHVESNRIITRGHGGSSDTTNNRMELTALINAYQSLGGDAEINIYSDSNLCVQTINQWAKGWAAKGWRRSGGPIANLELVQLLYSEALKRPKVRLQWIKAHNGWRWNEYVDTLSRLAHP